MKTQKVEDLVTILDEKDFTERNIPVSRRSCKGRKAFFDLIMQPAVFLEARTLAQYGYPSVLAVAERAIISFTNTKLVMIVLPNSLSGQ